jgi:hypothetical protein
MEPDEQTRKMYKIIAKAWMDKGFKERLLADPLTELKEEGFEISLGVQVRILEDTDKVVHLVLPRKPSSRELSDEELTHIAKGKQCKGCRACSSSGFTCSTHQGDDLLAPLI